MAANTGSNAGSAATRDRIFIAVAFVAYCAVTLWVTLHHEPWRDEADVWLTMRDGTFGEMWARTGYAGSPVLWYLLVAPFAKLGAPYVTLSLLNLAIIWAAALLFLAAAPFPKPTKALFVFSYFMVYEYAVIARSYALLTLLLFGIAALFGSGLDQERPLLLGTLVALLANTAPHGTIIAAFLGAIVAAKVVILRRWSDRDSLLGLAIMLAGGLAAWWQLRTPSDSPHPSLIRMLVPSNAKDAIANAFLTGFGRSPAFPAALVLLAVIFVAVARTPLVALFFAGTTLALTFLYVFVWFGGVRHAGLVLMVSVAALWMAREAFRPWRQVAVAGLTIAFLWSAWFSRNLIRTDLREPYSDSREMADFIHARHLESFDYAVHQIAAGESVIAYLPQTMFWAPALGQRTSYLHFDRSYESSFQMPSETAVELAKAHFAGREPAEKRWLLLLNAPLGDPAREGMELLYATRGSSFGISDEKYWLYAPIGGGSSGTVAAGSR